MDELKSILEIEKEFFYNCHLQSAKWDPCDYRWYTIDPEKSGLREEVFQYGISIGYLEDDTPVLRIRDMGKDEDNEELYTFHDCIGSLNHSLHLDFMITLLKKYQALRYVLSIDIDTSFAIRSLEEAFRFSHY